MKVLLTLVRADPEWQRMADIPAETIQGLQTATEDEAKAFAAELSRRPPKDPARKRPFVVYYTSDSRRLATDFANSRGIGLEAVLQYLPNNLSVMGELLQQDLVTDRDVLEVAFFLLLTHYEALLQELNLDSEKNPDWACKWWNLPVIK